MSVSARISTPVNLYCSEQGTHVFSSDGDNSSGVDTAYSADFCVDDDASSVDSGFETELDQMSAPQLMIAGCLDRQEVIVARQDAVHWMLKVHSYFNFRAETAYLSVIYFHRFLSRSGLPEQKGWTLQLLAVACISVAAKLEETSAPLLLDVQILQPNFLFKPDTVQRMELLVMSKLEWRLRILTPFYFLHHFIARLSYLYSDSDNLSSVLSKTSHLIMLQCCRVISVLDFTPSTIAAAAVLLVTGKTIDDHTLGCFHKRLNKEMVKRCFDLIKQNISVTLLLNGTSHNATVPCKKMARKFEDIQRVMYPNKVPKTT